MKTFLARILNNESGITAVEYGLFTALISIAIVGSVKLIG
jgi:Flp pilus assembly pilin Flp